VAAGTCGSRTISGVGSPREPGRWPRIDQWQLCARAGALRSRWTTTVRGGGGSATFCSRCCRNGD